MSSSPLQTRGDRRGRSTRRAIAWTIGGQFIVLAVQLFTQVAVAHLLTPREIGVFAVAMATTSLITATQGAGLQRYVISAADDRDLLDTAFTINAILSVTLAASIWLAGYVAAAVYDDRGVQGVMDLLTLPPLIGLFQFLPESMLLRDMRFNWTTIINTVRSLLTAGVTVLLAYWHFGPMSLGWGSVAGTLATTILFCAVGHRHVTFRPRLRQWRPVAAFGLQMIAVAGVSVLSTRLADLVLGRILGLNALGIYSRATGTNAVLWDNIHAVLARVFLSDVAERRRSGQSLRLSYLKSMDLVSALLWPAFAGLAVLSRPLVRLVYGAQWTGAADPLSLLAVSSMVLVSVGMSWEVFVICGQTRLQAKIELPRNLIGLCLFCLGCLYSISAAALARVLETMVTATLYRRPLARMTETDWVDLFPIFRRNMLLTGVAIAPSLGLMAWSGLAYDVPLGSIAASVGLGVLTWLIALRLMRHVLFHEAGVLAAKLRNLLLPKPGGSETRTPQAGT